MDGLGPAGKFGAHLANPVAQADHPIETLAGELAEVLGRVVRQVEAIFVAHHAQRVGMQRLGMAPGAVGFDGATRAGFGQRLRHRRSRAVAGAEKQDTHRTFQGITIRGRCETKTGMERRAGLRQQVADA